MAATKRREDAVFIEALRSMPALVLAREENRHADAKELIRAMMETGSEAGMAPCETNRSMFHASYWWFREALKTLAEDRGVTLAEMTQVLASIAVDFVARNG